MNAPRLTFFCELETREIERFFSDPGLIPGLASLGAKVSLAIMDHSPERAQVVRQLNEARIPVIAWLLLPRNEGYFFNAGNVARAETCYDLFCAWSREDGLRWDGIGIDIEPHIRELDTLASPRWWKLIPTMLSRVMDKGTIHRAQARYQSLVARMHGDDYQVESYVFPWIIDERIARSTLLQRVLRTADVRVDREIPMLYSSIPKIFRSNLGAGMLWSYAPDAQAIGIGSTGGGNEIPALSWDELERDLVLASRWTDDVAIHSLEACVAKGYLEKLRHVRWDVPVPIPLAQARRVDRLRQILRVILHVAELPLLIFAFALAVTVLLSRRRRKPTFPPD